MTTVHEVLKFLFELAPESMKEEWDHVGLQAIWKRRCTGYWWRWTPFRMFWRRRWSRAQS